MIAEKFQPLIAAGAVARALERGNMGERAIEQRGIGETIADAGLERARAALAAARRFARFPGSGVRRLQLQRRVS